MHRIDNLILLPFSGGKELVKFKIGKFLGDPHENSKKVRQRVPYQRSETLRK